MGIKQISIRTKFIAIVVVAGILILIGGIIYWKWVHRYADIFDFGMQIITVIAFILAFWSFYEAITQGEKLRSIYESVDTKYIGDFPNHISTLIEHIEQANCFVYILWDAVDIGSYVAPELHDRLIQKSYRENKRIS